ncbi:unnamed protein product [Dovyalis caffra]|uniref:Uncharacterized protein n=1 Tax=Dovyalis caffra TaxID=77055 RepID=A0AAV1RA21_9ROSI|nr:unnamed protein product [Dovyalis caffra]
MVVELGGGNRESRSLGGCFDWGLGGRKTPRRQVIGSPVKSYRGMARDKSLVLDERFLDLEVFCPWPSLFACLRNGLVTAASAQGYPVVAYEA